jgi:hypothetical protein
MSSAPKTRAKKPKISERQLRANNLKTLLLMDMQAVNVDYCLSSPKWVVSVVRDARKLLLKQK